MQPSERIKAGPAADSKAVSVVIAEAAKPQPDNRLIVNRVVLGLSLGIWIVIVGSLFMRISGAAIGITIQYFMEKNLKLESAIVGLSAVFFYISELLGAPYFGTRVDKHGWRRYLILGPILGLVANVINGGIIYLPGLFAVPLLLSVRLLEGLGTGANAPSSLAFLSAAGSRDAKVRSRSVGYFELATVGGVALGNIVGGVLWDVMHEHSFFAIAFIYVGIIFLLLPVPDRLHDADAAKSHPNPLKAMRMPSIYRFAPAWIAINGVLGIWGANFPNLLAKEQSKFPSQSLVGAFSEQASVAGLIMGGAGIMVGAGILIWSLFMHRLKLSNVMQIGTGGALVSVVFIYLINHNPLNGGLLIPFGVLVGIGLLIMSGFTPAALSILVQIAEKNATDRGTIMGLYSVLLGVGQFIGGAVGGIFAQIGGVDGLLAFTAILSLTASASVLYWRQKEHEF